MKIQILIPQYKETDEIIKPLLDSIAFQQRVSFDDFSVIICNDGSDVFLSETFLKSYPYSIEYRKEPHRGISGTRNALIKAATADYIMFCDADDQFFNLYGLLYIFRSIENTPFEYYVSNFIEEVKTENGYDYVSHEEDATFIHGKVFNRQFLIDHGIVFYEDLPVHEDGCFIAITQQCAKKRVYCSTAFYIWKWRDDSVCRNDPNYDRDTEYILSRSNAHVVDYFLEKDDRFIARSFAVSFMFNEYYRLNMPIWRLASSQQTLQKVESDVYHFYQKYETLWNEASDEDKVAISERLRTKNVKEGMLLERMSMPDWLRHIAKQSENKKERESWKKRTIPSQMLSI